MRRTKSPAPTWQPPGLLHPVALACLGVFVLNDHVVKSIAPGVVSGKLSDVTGLVYFPLLLQAAVETPWWWRAPYRSSDRVLAACAIVTGVTFTAINLDAGASEAIANLFAVGRWLAFDVVRGADSPTPFALTPDATDLVALPALWIAWRLGRAGPPAAPVA